MNVPGRHPRPKPVTSMGTVTIYRSLGAYLNVFFTPVAKLQGQAYNYM